MCLNCDKFQQINYSGRRLLAYGVGVLHPLDAVDVTQVRFTLFVEVAGVRRLVGTSRSRRPHCTHTRRDTSMKELHAGCAFKL